MNIQLLDHFPFIGMFTARFRIFIFLPLDFLHDNIQNDCYTHLRIYGTV